MSPRPLSVIFIFCLLTIQAAADQAQVVEQAMAERAMERVQAAEVVRHYCAPCGDSVYRQERVVFAYTAPFEAGEGYQLFLNNGPVDLAYLYVKEFLRPDIRIVFTADAGIKDSEN